MVMRTLGGFVKYALLGMLGVVAVIALAVVMFTRGMFGFDDWVVRAVVGSVQHYLEPTIVFEGFDYDAPYGVTLRGVTFVADADDEALATEVVRAAEVRMRLAEAPTFGGAISIAEVSLVEPEVVLIREDAADGGIAFRGLVPFVKTERVVDQESQPEGTKLSEIFELQKLELVNAGIRYDDGSGSPMVYSGIGLDVDITEEPNDEGGVWHRVTAQFGDAPLLDVDVDAKLDLDRFVVDVVALSLEADLTDPAGIRALPPQVQQLLGEAEATGTVEVDVNGRVLGRDPLNSTLNVDVRAAGIKAASGDMQLPVDTLTLPVRMADGEARIPEMVIEMLGGTLRVHDVVAQLTQPGMPTQVVWTVEGLRLERMARDKASKRDGGDLAEEDPHGYYGEIATSGGITLGLSAPVETLDGVGTFTLREGQLMHIPGLTPTLRALDLVGLVRGDDKHDDKIDAEFRLRPKGIVFDSFEASVPGATASLSGVFGLDQVLDMQMRLEAASGVPIFGNAVGIASGRLARFDITGTASDPIIQRKTGRVKDREIDEGPEAVMPAVAVGEATGPGTEPAKDAAEGGTAGE